MNFRRLKRSAVLVGVSALVVGGTLLGATQAQALSVYGTQPGAVTLTPSSGTSASTTPTYNSTACPSGFNGSAALFFIDPATPPGQPFGSINKDQLTPNNLSVAAPFSGTFQFPIGNVVSDLSLTTPTTVEMANFCFTAGNGTGAGEWVQDEFITFNANGTFTSSSTPPSGPVTTTTTLTAVPNPATVGATVTLTATVAPSAAAGTVQFEVGGTALGTPVTVSGGVASMTSSALTTAAGTSALTAVFTPTSTTAFTASTSATVTLTVNAGSPNSGIEPLSLSVPATGTFTLTVPTATVTLATTDGVTATGTLGNVTVADSRNNFPGWSVSGQDSNWTGSGTAAGGSFSGNQLGWTPTSVTLATGVTLGAPVTPASPGLGTTAAVLASAPHGSPNGFGTSTFGAGLTLTIPTGTIAGPYSSSLTITAVTSN